MGRIRTIKPEFPQSAKVGKLSRNARLLFLLLFTLADDEGRLRGNPQMLASLLYPYDADAHRHIKRWMSELEKVELALAYVVCGYEYVQITSWHKHQRISHPQASSLPPFPESSGSVPVQLRPYQGSRIKDQGLTQSAVPALPDSGPDPDPDPRLDQPPPLPALPLPADPSKAMWDTALRIMAASDVPESRARSMLGKWRKQLADDGALLGLLVSAGREHRIDMVSYVQAAVSQTLTRRSRVTSAGPGMLFVDYGA